jgi:MoxR-like ATPase
LVPFTLSKSMESNSAVKSWLQGRAKVEGDKIQFSGTVPDDLRKKARRAYQWVIGNAIYAPYFDVEYGIPSRVGSGEQKLWVTDKDSYASFALLPLLTLLTAQRLLLIGAPGRGKTTMATLMALIAGASLDDTRRAVQHGHPQMTHSDLLGSPLPSDLVNAESPADIRVIWKRWITLRVKIIDEYNRIPTKTQSCLLSLMAEGYAEIYEQTIHAGPSAWFLTANDDLGGGTFQVITALKDRIDAVVRTTPFNTEYLEKLAERVASGSTPEQVIPADIIFDSTELDKAAAEIRAVAVPGEVLNGLGFMLGQLDFCRRASDRLEYMNKDTLALAGRRLGQVCTEDCPLDKAENICTQSENGVSARVYQSILHYAKALAWFRGVNEVGNEDIRQVLPWVLHEKLHPNQMSPFFQKTENQFYLLDRLSWIRQLHDRAISSRAAYSAIHEPIEELKNEVLQELEQPNPAVLKRSIQRIRKQMESLLTDHELNAPVHHDLLALKQLVTDCQNRLHHLEQSK